MAHALYPAATVMLATGDALAAARAHSRRAAQSADELRRARASLAATRVRHATAMDRLARARAARAAAEGL